MNTDEEISGALAALQWVVDSLCSKELTGDGRTHIGNMMAQLYRKQNDIKKSQNSITRG